MNHKRIPVIVALAAIVGFGGLTQFSDGVRTVQVLGLFASGAVVGAAITEVVTRLKKNQTR